MRTIRYQSIHVEGVHRLGHNHKDGRVSVRLRHWLFFSGLASATLAARMIHSSDGASARVDGFPEASLAGEALSGTGRL